MRAQLCALSCRCKQPGHWSRDCPTLGGSGGGPVYGTTGTARFDSGGGAGAGTSYAGGGRLGGSAPGGGSGWAKAKPQVRMECGHCHTERDMQVSAVASIAATVDAIAIMQAVLLYLYAVVLLVHVVFRMMAGDVVLILMKHCCARTSTHRWEGWLLSRRASRRTSFRRSRQVVADQVALHTKGAAAAWGPEARPRVSGQAGFQLPCPAEESQFATQLSWILCNMRS